MKRFLAYILSFALFSPSLLSANTDCSPDPCWTGLYVGLNAGWGWSKADWQASPFGATATSDFTTQSRSNQMDGALFGGQIGFNWQIECLVVGAECDFDGSSLNGFNYSTFPSNLARIFDAVATGASSVYANLDWVASVRGRMGIAWLSNLIYFTGGAAWSRLQAQTLSFAQVAPLENGTVASGSFRKTKTGWIIGAGYEKRIASKWSVRGEYLYYHFGKGPTTDVIFIDKNSDGVNVSIGNTNINSFRLGVNYIFGWHNL